MSTVESAITPGAPHELENLFHRLWANSKEGVYDKQAWGRLQILLNQKGIMV